MTNKRTRPQFDLIDPHHVAALREAGRPLFETGECFITPAVSAFLEKHGRLPNALLGPHCHGDFGVLDPPDLQANETALLNGGQVFSKFPIEGRDILVITSRVSDSGVRHTTVVLFAEEN